VGRDPGGRALPAAADDDDFLEERLMVARPLAFFSNRFGGASPSRKGSERHEERGRMFPFAWAAGFFAAAERSAARVRDKRPERESWLRRCRCRRPARGLMGQVEDQNDDELRDEEVDHQDREDRIAAVK
jgi:hypothetical protein